MSGYSIVEFSSLGLIEVDRVRTVEEAYAMLKKWCEYRPESQFELLEVA